MLCVSENSHLISMVKKWTRHLEKIILTLHILTFFSVHFPNTSSLLMCLNPPWLKLYLAEQKILKKMQWKLSEQRKLCLKLKGSYKKNHKQQAGKEIQVGSVISKTLLTHLPVISTNICQDRASRRSLGNPVYRLTVCPAGKFFDSAAWALPWWTESYSWPYPVWTQKINCSFSLCSTLYIF